MLKTNEGTVDRILRVIVGIALLAMVFVGPQTVWGWVGSGSAANWTVWHLPALFTARHQHLPGQTTIIPRYMSQAKANPALVQRRVFQC